MADRYRFERIRKSEKPKMPSYKLPSWAVDVSSVPSKAPVSYSTPRRPERQQYTGDQIRGIVLIDKQGYAPVTVDEDPKNVSKIRRG